MKTEEEARRAVSACVLIVVSIAFGIMLLTTLKQQQHRKTTEPGLEESRRKLRNRFDWRTSETLTTYNGIVPQVTCPMGTYRPQGSTKLVMITGQREDGCVPCPRGRYGQTEGLESASCTGPCPVGRFSEQLGLISKDDCELCPAGRVGANSGLTTRDCSGNCPAGKYSSKTGATATRDCLNCPTGYRGWQCKSDLSPRGSV